MNICPTTVHLVFTAFSTVAEPIAVIGFSQTTPISAPEAIIARFCAYKIGDQNKLEIGFKTLQIILERPRLLPLFWISIFRKTIVKWCCAVGILLPTLNQMQLTEWFDITWHFRLELELTFLSTWHRSSVVAPCSEQYISCESVRGQVSTGNDVN